MSILSEKFTPIIKMHNFFTSIRPVLIMNVSLAKSARIITTFSHMNAELIFDPIKTLEYFKSEVVECCGIGLVSPYKPDDGEMTKLGIVLYGTYNGKEKPFYEIEILDHCVNKEFWKSVQKSWLEYDNDGHYCEKTFEPGSIVHLQILKLV